MTIPADRAKLPLVERLQAMEILWDSLSREQEYEPSPGWHKAVLDERIAELEQGLHSDWDHAKERIRKSRKPSFS